MHESEHWRLRRFRMADRPAVALPRLMLLASCFNLRLCPWSLPQRNQRGDLNVEWTGLIISLLAGRPAGAIPIAQRAVSSTTQRGCSGRLWTMKCWKHDLSHDGTKTCKNEGCDGLPAEEPCQPVGLRGRHHCAAPGCASDSSKRWHFRISLECWISLAQTFPRHDCTTPGCASESSSDISRQLRNISGNNRHLLGNAAIPRGSQL